MHKTAQAWFVGGPSSDIDKKPSSLLANWNAYAAASDVHVEEVSSFDLEAAVRTANDKVTSTFSVLLCAWGIYGAWNAIMILTGFQEECLGASTLLQALFHLESLLCTLDFSLLAGVFFIFISFTIFLPVMVLKPQKFAICFTIGCAFIVGSFFALKGPKNQLVHMLSKERLPFTLGFIGSMFGTICVSMVLHSYFLSVLFSIIQVLALLYYVMSLFPWRISWNEISVINSCLLCTEMLWKITFDISDM